jgi:hypothetical protein
MLHLKDAQRSLADFAALSNAVSSHIELGHFGHDDTPEAECFLPRPDGKGIVVPLVSFSLTWRRDGHFIGQVELPRERTPKSRRNTDEPSRSEAIAPRLEGGVVVIHLAREVDRLLTERWNEVYTGIVRDGRATIDFDSGVKRPDDRDIAPAFVRAVRCYPLEWTSSSDA